MSIFTKTATLRSGEDPGNTSTSGLGSLASQLIRNQSNLLAPNRSGLDDYVAGVDLSTDYMSRILPQENMRTLQLGPQAYIDPRDQRYVHDAYQYFLNQQGGGTGGGQDAATMPPKDESVVPYVNQPGEGQTGIFTTSAAQNMGGGAQNPLTQMITTPTGETMTVKQAMTQDAAYSLPGQSDPFLASGAAGGARLPVTQATTTLPSGDVFATFRKSKR
jgi:hypothetical protein